MQIALISIQRVFFCVSMSSCSKFINLLFCARAHTHSIIDYLILPSEPFYSFSVFSLFVLFHVFFFLTSLLEYNCFTMVCQFLLYHKVNQLYINMYPHISSLLHLPPTLRIPPLQVDTKHRAGLPVLCGCFPLAIYFTFGSVYMSMPLSHFVPASRSPLCPQVHSLVGLHLYSRFVPRFFVTIFFFLDSIYM